MSPKTVFKKIIDREIPAEIVYEDQECLAFKDINPQAPIHVIVIPKKEIPNLEELREEDEALIGHLFIAMQRIAQQMGISTGYRVVLNNGPDAGQEVMHMHFHLLAGRKFDWPPG
ncbi:MAG TPA: histidine triad nucleotide-binding protein [Thermogutta sp.]|nr:histidine triad nucleotide-binding protein [Thermogutta sp.]HOP76528.1 histidine triad nucleotide-binding protein [Thermogutta sp.]HPU05627.1 histidine triad nucleotide-binding protein [Thermogutta sp.]HPZ81819.1 histidine triad nucleotide-binding protein [Thermogutta sp.]HQF12844.1 histidine triad nucleotide-binding protein [Thermogutta sp.]